MNGLMVATETCPLAAAPARARFLPEQDQAADQVGQVADAAPAPVRALADVNEYPGDAGPDQQAPEPVEPLPHPVRGLGHEEDEPHGGDDGVDEQEPEDRPPAVVVGEQATDQRRGHGGQAQPGGDEPDGDRDPAAWHEVTP
jgi:hypothetical protein